MKFDDPSSYTLNEALIRDLKYRYVDITTNEKGEELTRGAVLLVHGYPDTWFTWHKLIERLVQSGYRCIVPSTVGYCGTVVIWFLRIDKESPEDLRRYTRVEIAKDMNALLDYINVSQVFVVGHDWGSLISQRFSALFPNRVKKLAVLSVPYFPPARAKHSIETLIAAGYDLLKYQLVWREDVTINRLDSSEAKLKSFFANLFSYPTDQDTRPACANLQDSGSERWEKEVHPQTAHKSSLLGEHYEWHVEQFRKHGMRGPCSYYKVWEINSELELDVPLGFEMPFMQIIFQGEPIFSDEKKKEYAEASDDLFKTIVVPDGITHWYMLEKPDLICKYILEWIQDDVKSTL
ncbi:alpha/beta-hydrolase [Wallemia mellicola]|uniref:Alpha/beta-hydrolase n=1 Tax=Wallemia mellicola TaxID=1708541 RepID=A0A4T0NM72_9BASI|nr:hypothetical protein E3Q24_02236 [Wallemia mellicola]TIB75788.1 hypothetical protein E3Q23_02196 [Wallemia mellicola]TIB78680.1 alpha/beta-hydrolase [Wallemia mellicola]TIB84213.1 alpha/beta-hydrolase [Wallemia mellicola]TIB87305.1 alpha/beta-hydrolase [Wallemia mellicola]